MIKTLQNAKNYSSNSKKIVFDPEYKDIILGDMNFGDPDIDDIYYGTSDKSIENVVQDILSIAIHNIGDVVIRTEKHDPSGYGQVDRWSFIANDDYTYHEDTEISILGRKVIMREGYDLTHFVSEVMKVIESYIDEGKYFTDVEGIDDTTIEVEYADRRPHSPIISIDEDRVEMIQEIIRDFQFGYGQWIYLGSKEIEFEAVSETLYYYKRVG